MTHATKIFIIKQRFLMIRQYQQGKKVSQIAQDFQISRKTFYKWLHRYEALGKEGLLDRSHKPKSPHPRALKPKAIRWIKRLREKTGYGPRRLLVLLEKLGIHVSEYAVYKTLVRLELIERHKKKRRKKPKKYHVSSPGEWVQMDTKYLDTLPGFPYRYYQYTAQDAFTRLRVLRIYDELSAENSVRFLKEVVGVFPFPVKAVRTDNGVEFTYGPFKKDHPFTLECVRLGIRHRLNKPAHPESNGRVERSHRTDDEEFYRPSHARSPQEWIARLPWWERFFNYERSHMGLGNQTPFEFWKNYLKEQKQKSQENCYVKNVT